MSDHNDLLPEERDEQNQSLITSLRHSYATHSEDKQSLTRIRERLLQATADSLPRAGQTPSVPLMPHAHQKGKTDMQFIHSKFYEGKTWQQRLGTLVAVILVLVLVGSFATLFYVQSHHSNVSSQSVLSPGWKQVASFSGTGSKTLSNLNIQLTQLWGNSIGCVGNGEVKFEFVEISHNAISGCSSDTPSLQQDASVSSLIEPQEFQFSQSSKLTIHTIKVTATGTLTWYVHLASANVTAMPFLSTLTAPKYRWISYSGLGGNGNGAMSSFVDSVRTVGLVMRCDTKSALQIKFGYPNSAPKTLACDTNTNFYVIHFLQSEALQNIQVHPSNAGSWYLETVRCTNENACSSL